MERFGDYIAIKVLFGKSSYNITSGAYIEMGSNMDNDKEKSITEELEEMAVNICHNFCKHNNKGKCQWVLEGHICPLGKLY